MQIFLIDLGAFTLHTTRELCFFLIYKTETKHYQLVRYCKYINSYNHQNNSVRNYALQQKVMR